MNRTSFSTILAGTMLAIAALATTARAEDNTVVTINGFGSNVALDVTIGSTGTNNSMTISGGGSLTNRNSFIGNGTTAHDNYVIVTGPNSLWTNTSAVSENAIQVGIFGDRNRLSVLDGGRVEAMHMYIARQSGSDSNSVLVSGAGSQLNLGGSLEVGTLGKYNTVDISTSAVVRVGAMLNVGPNATFNNTLTISSGGSLISDSANIGAGTAGNNNRVIVTGAGSVWTNRSATGDKGISLGVWPSGGVGSDGNSLIISAGGTVVSSNVFIGRYTSSESNSVLVTGVGSRLNVHIGIEVGNGPDNSMIVSNSALVNVGSGLNVGNAAGSHNNTLTITAGSSVVSSNSLIGANSGNNKVIVSGSGTTWTNTGTAGELGIKVGLTSATNNQLIVSDGAYVQAQDLYISRSAGSISNSVLVTGNNSLFNLTRFAQVGTLGGGANRLTISNGASVWVNSGNLGGTLDVGSSTIGSNSLLVTHGGLLQANTMIAGSSAGNSISNRGGIYQFTTATPTVTPNGAGRISLTNGTVSFRGVTTAPTAPVSGLTYQGNNTLRLNNATNASVASYTFDSVANTANAANYQKLTLTNGSRWQSTTLTIGSGGALSGNGTVASANVTNFGTIAPGFSPGQLTLTGNLVLASSSVLAMEIGGTGVANYDQLVVGGNVAVTGSLSLAMINAFSPTPGDSFTLIDNQGANPISGLFNGLTNNAFIDASGNGIDAFFRIQYDAGTGNDLVLLAVVPEPSSLLLLIGSGCLLAWRGRRH